MWNKDKLNRHFVNVYEIIYKTPLNEVKCVETFEGSNYRDTKEAFYGIRLILMIHTDIPSWSKHLTVDQKGKINKN